MRFIALIGALLMTTAADARDWKLVIHGGAGVIEPSRTTPQTDAAIRAALNRSLDAGSKVLASGGSALDAVEAAVLVLEDDPNFNSGRGAVFTWDETHELDASIMDGRDRAAGAVSGVTRTRNPIVLARAVMERSVHVFLSGPGALRWGSSRRQGPHARVPSRRVDPSDGVESAPGSRANVPTWASPGPFAPGRRGREGTLAPGRRGREGTLAPTRPGSRVS